MAVKSKLKSFADGDSGRQPYDRDKVPAGYDPGWWDLALKYEQGQERSLAEEEADGIRSPFKVSPRPVIYMEIKSRAESMGLTDMRILEEMIERFWDYEFIRCDSDYKLNEFCGRTTFQDLYAWVMNERLLEELKIAPRTRQQNRIRRTDITKRETDGRRQGNNWLCDAGEDDGVTDISELRERLGNLLEREGIVQHE